MEFYSKEEYKKAHVELLEILKYIPKNDFKKIPNNYIQHCIEEIDPNYIYTYDINKKFEEQGIMKLTKILISNLYIKYWATNERKKEIKTMFQQEIKNKKLENDKIYSYDNLFKEKTENNSNIVLERAMIPIKKNIWTKIFDKFKKIFKLT